jgi:hypothetical protein
MEKFDFCNEKNIFEKIGGKSVLPALSDTPLHCIWIFSNRLRYVIFHLMVWKCVVVEIKLCPEIYFPSGEESLLIIIVDGLAQISLALSFSCIAVKYHITAVGPSLRMMTCLYIMKTWMNCQLCVVYICHWCLVYLGSW